MAASCQEREFCREDYRKAAFELSQAAACLSDTFLSKDSLTCEIAYAGLRAAHIKCSVARGIYLDHVAEHGCEMNGRPVIPPVVQPVAVHIEVPEEACTTTLYGSR